MNMNRSNKLQELAGRLVDREVYYCVSSLVSTLLHIASNCDTDGELDFDELINLCQRDDWEPPVDDFIQNDADLSQLEEIADEHGYWNDVLAEVRAAIPNFLHPYVVTYYLTDDPDAQEFECWAENPDHAEEQCKNAEPDIFSMTTELTDDTDLDDLIEHNPTYEDAIRKAVWKLVSTPEQYEWVGREYNLDPEQIEVYEHWIVSEWAARFLKQEGEVVGEVCGLTIWGRCTTGQAIALDNVWESKAAAMWPEELKGLK